MYQGYGLSEATPIISANCPHAHKLGSSGKPLPHMDIKIVDDKMQVVPTGKKGEIIIRGGNVMKGYWKTPKPRPRPLWMDGSGQEIWDTSTTTDTCMCLGAQNRC